MNLFRGYLPSRAAGEDGLRAVASRDLHTFPAAHRFVSQYQTAQTQPAHVISESTLNQHSY